VITVSDEELEWLRTADDVEIDDTMDKWFDEPRACHLEKHYAAISYLLSGSDHGGEGPVAFIGNQQIGEEIDYEFAYGPGRVFDAEQTRAIAQAIAVVPPAVVERRLADDVLTEIYPFSIAGIDDVSRDELRADLERLRRHVAQAAEKRQGLLVAVY
jgi:hypothetical protein